MENNVVLIADDDKEIVKLIADTLEDEGFQVIKAYNGTEAMEFIRLQRYYMLESLLAGRMADRLGVDKVVISGIILILLTMAVLAQAGSLAVFLLAGIIYGVGFGAVQPSLQAMVVQNIPQTSMKRALLPIGNSGPFKNPMIWDFDLFAN